MENGIIKETTDILKKLSPQNQEYFMNLVKVAEVAENSTKNSINNKEAIQSAKSTKQLV